MTQPMKPVPAPDSDSEPFWEGCRAHRLMIQRCASCGTLRFPARRLCAACHSDEAEWVEVSGRGTVFSWIVVVHPVPRDVYAGEVPYVVALIDLDEGVRMASNIVGCDPHAVEPGMKVEVVFEAGEGGFTLPKFRPAAA